METNFIIDILVLYQMPAMFLGAILFGETVILAASFLAAQGLWSLWTVFWVSFLGTLSADAIWFLYGHRILSFFHRYETYRRHSEKFLAKLEKFTGSRPYLALLFVKAVYGTRILTIIYLSLRKVSFLRFLAFDAIGSAWWLAVLVFVGWLGGRSLGDLLPFLEQLEYYALAIVFIVVIWRLAFTWISKRAIKELEEE